MSQPLEALDEQAAGEALRETCDACIEEMTRDLAAQCSSWEDVIGTDRDVFSRFATELRARGFEIVRRS